MKNIYSKFDLEAQEVLSDIFVILEEKFATHAVSNDVLLIKYDKQKNSLVACCAKADNFPGPQEDNEKLEEELKPYFDLLKSNFKKNVIHEFIVYSTDQDLYIRALPDILTERIIKKVKDPLYKIPSLSKK